MALSYASPDCDRNNCIFVTKSTILRISFIPEFKVQSYPSMLHYPQYHSNVFLSVGVTSTISLQIRFETFLNFVVQHFISLKRNFVGSAFQSGLFRSTAYECVLIPARCNISNINVQLNLKFKYRNDDGV